MPESKAMRVVFGETLVELAQEFPKMVVLDSDVSSSTQTKLFGDQYPERFYNCGIAEANMVGIASGMAAAGLIPVAATFAFLMALRAGDDVRSLVAYNNLNVKLSGGYCGLSDFADGASHQSVEDIGAMRAIPNMTILTPTDISSTRGCVRAMLEHEGPVYLRLSREAVGELHTEENCEVVIGKAKVLRQGKDVTLVACGSPLAVVLEAADQLAAEGISAEVLEYTTLKPFDADALAASAAKTGAVVTVEEHNIMGGLGSAAAEVLGERCPSVLRRVGICDTFGESGPYQQLLKKYGISSENIVAQAKEALSLKR